MVLVVVCTSSPVSFIFAINLISPRAYQCQSVWYVPRSWVNDTDHDVPKNIVQAATLANQFAVSTSKYIDDSRIPLIVHQTWMNLNLETWSESICEGVERWLEYAITPGEESPEMAYFFWDDEGMRQLVESAEPKLGPAYSALPQNVEKADLFRILVSKWFGGIVRVPFS